MKKEVLAQYKEFRDLAGNPIKVKMSDSQKKYEDLWDKEIGNSIGYREGNKTPPTKKKGNLMNRELYREIGHRIAMAREIRGWHQGELAHATGFSRSKIASIEAGDMVVLHDLILIAKRLNVKPLSLLRGLL